MTRRQLKDVVLSGYGVRLRPVQERDCEFIVRQRRHPRARQFLGETQDCLVAQRAYIRAQKAVLGDYYFLIESEAADPVGTIGVHCRVAGSGQWGRFLVSPDYNAAAQALTLLFDFCFTDLALGNVGCTVVAANHKARALYEWAGHVLDTAKAPDLFLNKTSVPQVSYFLSRNGWQEARIKVSATARKLRLERLCDAELGA